MDEELQRLRRDVIAREGNAAERLNAFLDRIEGFHPGVIRRIFDSRTADIVVLLVDATLRPAMVALPHRTPGVFDPIWVKKMDPSPNPVTIMAPKGTTFENGQNVWVTPLTTQFHSEGPFAFYGTTWVRI